MREFFKGWRRKAGGLTLLFSVVISIAWFRSYLITDWLHVPAWQPAISSLNSFDGVVQWSKIAPINRDARVIEDNDLEDLLIDMLASEAEENLFSRTARKRIVSEIRTSKLRFTEWNIPFGRL